MSAPLIFSGPPHPTMPFIFGPEHRPPPAPYLAPYVVPSPYVHSGFGLTRTGDVVPLPLCPPLPGFTKPGLPSCTEVRNLDPAPSVHEQKRGL